MKKLFFIILALGILTVNYSQSYQPFQTSSTNPNWSQAFWIGPGDTPDLYWYEINTDTTIGAFVYSKLEYHSTGTNVYYGALRENASKQVFYVLPDSTNEMLIYDFSLQLNDTLFNVWCNQFGTWAKDTLKVTTLDSVQLNGNYHEHFILENLNEAGQLEWYESFGSTRDLVMHRPYLSVSGDNYLTCFHNNQGLSYTTSQAFGWIGSETCFLSAENYELKKLDIFPNPVIDELFINTENTFNNSTASIVDLGGKVMSKSNLKDNYLYVGYLQKGIYILQIEDNAVTYRVKFIKN